ARLERIALRHAARNAEWQAPVSLERSSKPLAPSVLAAEVWQVIKDEDWILANGTGKGWARRLWDWQPDRACGGSGGAGLGYGLPAALGVTLAHRGSGKLCVNLQADGDLLYVVGGLYTAAHHRLPLLTVMFNNRTYGNDEEHQEAVAKTRARPVENKGVGIRIDDPAPDRRCEYPRPCSRRGAPASSRSEEHTSEPPSRLELVCRLPLAQKNKMR